MANEAVSQRADGDVVGNLESDMLDVEADGAQALRHHRWG